jgi:hypothetical protein
MIEQEVSNSPVPAHNGLSATPPLCDLGAYGYFFEGGNHLWAYKERNWWFNQIRMDDKMLSGDVGDWRAGGSIAFGLHEVVAGKADHEIVSHFNPRVLAHIKTVAAEILAGKDPVGDTPPTQH